MNKALQQFTERRMRPGMGKGVSIPSQLRWLGYVDRWAKHGKVYVERQVEVLEVHCWGLRDGVKIQVEGFVEDGKLIKNFHTFTGEEREVVRGEVKKTGMTQVVSEVMYKNGLGGSSSNSTKKDPKSSQQEGATGDAKNPGKASLDKQASLDGVVSARSSRESLPTGTGDVVFRPSKRVVLPTNDINIDVERRNNAAFDLTMVTAVAHVWFNAFFEGHGPEQNGIGDDSGVFEIDWLAMDGIKGSSRKGTQAFERIAVVWRALSADEGSTCKIITEPKEGEEVQQTDPADWKGAKGVEPSEDKDLGLRKASPTNSTTNVSKANSIREENEQNKPLVIVPGRRDSGESDTRDVQPHGPNGETTINDPIAEVNRSESETENPTFPSQAEGTRADAGSQELKAESHRGGGKLGDLVNDLKYHVSGAASTSDLPDGRPEDEMKNAKEHGLGHLTMGKKKTSS